MRRLIAYSAVVMLAASQLGAQDTTVVVKHIDPDSASRPVAARRMAPPPGAPYGTRFPARPNNFVYAKDPHLAAGLSFIFPGGGQYYAENPSKGFLITALSIGAPIIGYANVQYRDPNRNCNTPFGPPQGYCGTRTDWTPAAIGLTVGIGTWLYGIATAGSDALKWNKDHHVRFVSPGPGRYGFAVAVP